MADIEELLELAKLTAARAGGRLSEKGVADFSFSEQLPREVKASGDIVLEKVIIQALAATGVEILSEECGLVSGTRSGGLRFIVDPLDGTFNFVRNLGPCAVSIALWREDSPVFGVLFDITNKWLFWGGKDFGARKNGTEIHVSGTNAISEAAVCTGFPVRFDFSGDSAWSRFRQRAVSFAKVRMIGSAASSLACVADGRVDAYFEENIMLWDVAAGIAIVEGAGGRVLWSGKPGSLALDVYADNGRLEGNP